MRYSDILLSAAAFVVLTFQASAGIVSQYVAGTIGGSSTIDTYGYFGPAGADLSGKQIALYFQYTSNYFVSIPCKQTGCASYVSKQYSNGTLANEATTRSVLISLQVNGVGRSFAPFKQGEVYSDNSGSGQNALAITSDVDPTLPLATVDVMYSSPIVFGAQLSPNNKPVASSAVGDTVQVSIPTEGGSSYRYESLTFTVAQSAQ